jgi:hypothetical protein
LPRFQQTENPISYRDVAVLAIAENIEISGLLG